MKTGYLRARGQLQSFLTEIGRFTKTSGFHYYVTLDPPEIGHHGSYWSVSPTGDGGFDVGGVLIYEDRVIDKRGNIYQGIDGLSAREIYQEIINAIIKYSVATFMQEEHASDGAYGVKLNFLLKPKPIQEAQGKKMLETCHIEVLNFLEALNDVEKIKVILDPPRVFDTEYDIWELQPWPDCRKCGCVWLNREIAICQTNVYRHTLINRFDGIRCGDNVFIAKDIFDAILSAIARYALKVFDVDLAKLDNEITVDMSSTG
ncbi:MAG: hypothetical protein JHC26_01925 [Thermofilum sp.]|jgi:hypothetical protein|uniref:hypothetical protein n=1 Tax=Thermofilum sp. TaxID=1961369 RepID=UPI0025888A85|nr:hypothetical protein [Thermofilum sp.]MCI4407821.1 hypothetical protein [Thermofilum sp.]